MKFVLTFCILLSTIVLNAQQTEVSFKLVLPDSNNFVIKTFRCYISEICFKYANGDEFKEQNSFHLLDLEKPESFQITISGAPKKELASISFNIGTDSLTNVTGIMDGDLDPIKGMYWTWNSGYINFKIEGDFIMESQTNNFEYHVGGYLAPFQTVRKVEYNTIHPEAIVITIDLSDFMNKIDVSEMPVVMSPGNNAVVLADKFVSVFHVEEK